MTSDQVTSQQMASEQMAWASTNTSRAGAPGAATVTADAPRSPMTFQHCRAALGDRVLRLQDPSSVAMPPVAELERLWSHGDDDGIEALVADLGGRRQLLYQAVRAKFACPIHPQTVAALLALASRQPHRYTVCTGNNGVRLCLSAPWSVPRWQQGQCHLAHNGVLISLDMARVASVWRLRRPGPGRVVTALEGLDAEGRWLWTLSAGGGEDAWVTLLADSLIPERARACR